MNRLLALMLMLLAGCASRPPTVVSQEIAEPSRPVQPEPLALENRVLLWNAGLPLDLEDALAELKDPGLARMLCHVAVYHGHWNNAWLAFKTWARLDGMTPSRQKLNIRILAMLGDIHRAARLLQQYLDLQDVEKPILWTEIGNLLLFRIEPERGVAVWDALEHKPVPTSEVSLRRYRDLMLAFQRLPDALEAAEKLAHSSATARDWELTATLARDLRRPEVQIRALRHLLQLEPDNREAAYSLAAVLYESDQVMDAVSVLTARERDPLALYTAISFLQEQERHEQARQWFEKLKNLDEQLEGKAYFTGRAAEILGMPDQALEWYGKEQGDYYARARMQMAVLMADDGQGDRAMEMLRQLRARADVDEVRLARLGAQLAIQLQRPADAEAWFTSVEPVGEQGKLLRYDRAMFLLEQERVDEALEIFRRLAEENPEDLNLLNAYAYTLVDRTDRYDEAEPLLLKVVQAAPDNAAFLDSLGWLQYRQGKLEQAEATLRKAWNLDPDPEIAAHLGEVLWKLGRREEAVRIWNQARKAHPDNRALLGTVRRFIR